ncbi:MAG: 50S ribosomal protein L10 [Anaerolineales bacterium]|nr:MAG: 50S ribosomal protein L10 [Anaerolineales bacterium]
MAISRKRKNNLLAEYKDTLQRNSALVFTAYTGLSVKELEDLRKKLREIGGEYFIVKNTIVKRAFAEIGLSDSENSFTGPTAIGATSEEIPAMVKVLVDLSKESNKFEVKGAIIDGRAVSADELRRLAELPPMPIMQAQMLGVLGAPASQFARVLAGSLRQLLNVLKAHSEAEGEASPA